MMKIYLAACVKQIQKCLKGISILQIVITIIIVITVLHVRDGTGQDFLDPTRPVNFKIIAG